MQRMTLLQVLRTPNATIDSVFVHIEPAAARPKECVGVLVERQEEDATIQVPPASCRFPPELDMFATGRAGESTS